MARWSSGQDTALSRRKHGFDSRTGHHENKKALAKASAFLFLIKSTLGVGEIIFDDEIPCGDEIRLDGGRVDLISSAKQISSAIADFILA